VRRVYVRLLLDPQVSQAGSLREAQRYAELFEGWADDQGSAEAMTLIGNIRFWQGKVATAEEDLERASVHARRAGSRRQEIEIAKLLTLCISEGPVPTVEGLRRLESILEGSRGDRRVEISVASKRAQSEAMLGRFEPARALIATAKVLAHELGDQITQTAVLRDSGRVEELSDEPATAETEVRAGYEILERMSDLGHLASFAPQLGDIVYAQGRYEEAFQLSEFAERITIEGDVDADVGWRQLRAKTLARSGRHDEAERLAREAVHLAADTDYLDVHAHALFGLAEVLRLAGRDSDAAAAAREALELCRRKGNDVGATRAERLLAELAY
jgi:tetratricopeptide (TPR) repeat protein